MNLERSTYAGLLLAACVGYAACAIQMTTFQLPAQPELQRAQHEWPQAKIEGSGTSLRSVEALEDRSAGVGAQTSCAAIPIGSQKSGSIAASWSDRIVQAWSMADSEGRERLVDEFELELSRLARDERPSDSSSLHAMRNQVLDLARRAENDAGIVLRLIPMISTLVPELGEPVLLGYLGSPSAGVEARAAAAEALVENGWWTSEQLMNWFDGPALGLPDRELLLVEVLEALGPGSSSQDKAASLVDSRH